MSINDYNANETNGLLDGHAYHGEVDYSHTYSLLAVKECGGKITRVRLLTERWPSGRIADVSYIHATMPNGKVVPVEIGIDNCTPLNQIKKAMIDWAKREGVYAKALGLLDESNWSILY